MDRFRFRTKNRLFRGLEDVGGEGARGKENVGRSDGVARCGVDLEATQFRYNGRSVSPVDISIPTPTRCFLPREQDSLSFSLSRRMSHSLPAYTRRHARATRARARSLAHASAISQILTRLRVYAVPEDVLTVASTKIL